MYMLKSVVSVALFAAYAAAQTAGTLAFTSVPTSIQAGTTYELTWAGGDSTQPVTIILRQGDPNNLDTVETITTTATGGSYSWAVPTTIVNGGDYAFEIVQGTANNYAGPFAIAGGSGVASVSGSATASGSASASASASDASASASASVSASSASASASASASSSASSTLSRSSASRTSATAAATSAPSSNSGAGLQSPIALVFGAIAAMFALA